jgi:ketosteroid isomerase-like protein
MRNPIFAVLVLAVGATGSNAQNQAESNAALKEQVRRAELAFAKTMADRDHAAFVKFVAADAVFGGSAQVLRGPKEVGEGWKKYFDGPVPPFSWEPEQVEVIESGTLAFSSGPVRDPSGKRTGTFNSVWRRQPGGEWTIIFDRGCPVCNCTPLK